MLTKNQVEDLLSFIRARIEGLEGGKGMLGICAEVHGRFESLRQQYREAPQSLNGSLEQLTSLRHRFDAFLAGRLTAIVDHYQALVEDLRRQEEEKAFWREVLIGAASRLHRADLKGDTCVAQVKASQARHLPAAGTSQRQNLESVILAAGLWEKVSQLSGPRLNTALQKNLFGVGDRESIERLCPVTVSHSVRMLTNGVAGGER